MRTTTVRITQETATTLRDLSRSTRLPMQRVLSEALDAYARRLLFDETNAAYAALRADEAGWRRELEERAAWEATLVDGLAGD